MDDYLKYKQWWLTYGYRWDTGDTIEPEEQFEDHINSMTTYELMETLANGETTND
jgi:hypothetical protein